MADNETVTISARALHVLVPLPRVMVKETTIV